MLTALEQLATKVANGESVSMSKSETTDIVHVVDRELDWYGTVSKWKRALMASCQREP